MSITPRDNPSPEHFSQIDRLEAKPAHIDEMVEQRMSK
jgi:hypothetical protein